MSSASFAQARAQGEPVHITADEIAWLQGAFVSSLLCGVQITLSVMSFLAVLGQHTRWRLRIALLVYIFLLCGIMTAGQQFGLLFIQMGFIQSRNYPGGPNEFISHEYTTPVSLASTSLFVLANWMMESLMVWRCKVVCYVGDRPMWMGIIVPFVLLIGAYVAGCLFISQMMQGRYPIRYALIYSGISFLLNLTVTGIIAGRLLVYRRRIRKQFGPGHGSYYASVATVLIESASFYSVFVILFIIFFCVGTATSNVLQQSVAQVQSISSQLIVYRIAKGKEWRDRPIVSTSDWRGSMEAQVENDVVHLEVSASTAQGDGHSSSILSKDEETPISAPPVDVTISQREEV